MKPTDPDVVNAIQKKHLSNAIEFEFEPVPGETYPEDFTFTAREIVGRRFKGHGQELICSKVEHIPGQNMDTQFLVDFTKGYKRSKTFNSPPWTPETIQWKNMLANLGVMGKTLDHLPQRDVVYCVGSGPSLMRNWPLLKAAHDNPRAAVVGCNELLQYLPPEWIDYYCCLDGSSPDKWWKNLDCSKTTAVFAPIVPPSFCQANWQEVLWYKIGFQSELNAVVANKRGNLTSLFPFFGVGPLELQVAWLMKPKVIVLVGHSYCYDMIDGVIYEHINEPLTEDRWEGILREISEFATTDLEGRPVVTDYNILVTAFATLASCQMLLDAGVRVINATEGGILRSNPDLPAYRNRAIFPERLSLAEAVEMVKGV